MLLDVIAGAVGGNPRLGLAAEQFVNRHVQRLAGDVPQRQIHCADGIDHQAHLPVRDRRPIHDVPQPLDVQRILIHEELGQMLLDHIPGARAPLAVSFECFISTDFDGRARHFAGVWEKERSLRFVFRIN